MKSKFKKTVIVVATIFTLISCEDFLTIKNPSSINTDNYPATVEQCNMLLTTCYAGVHRPGLYGWLWFPYEMYMFDKTADLFGAESDRVYAIENNTDVNNTNISQTYIDIFKVIRAANETMEGVEKYRLNATTDEQGALDYIYGQALFFRALGYWHGQIFFEIDNVNGKGLPIFRKPPQTIAEMSIPRNKTGECYAFMTEDLEEAARMLAGKNDKYRVGEWAAKGLLAKVCMQAGSNYYTKAKEVMEDIINNSGKSLVSFDIYKDMFYGNEANEFNSESLYEIDMITDIQGIWKTYSMGHSMSVVFGPTFINLDTIGSDRIIIKDPWEKGEYNYPSSVAIARLCAYQNNYMHDSNLKRFGFPISTRPLVVLNPAFDKTVAISLENYPDTYNYPYMVDDANYVTNSVALRKQSDPRLLVCAAQPWVDHGVDYKGRPTLYSSTVGGFEHQDILGWWLKKFTNLNGVEYASAASPEHGRNMSSNANIPVVRLADIYLLYAELMQKLGDDVTALEYVNKVHRRAYNNYANGGKDYTSLTERTKALDANDILANDVIKYERWAELFGEGQWWWDIRRWKLQDNEVNVYKSVILNSIDLVSHGNPYYVQPIPQLEMDRNKGIQQSEGYK